MMAQHVVDLGPGGPQAAASSSPWWWTAAGLLALAICAGAPAEESDGHSHHHQPAGPATSATRTEQAVSVPDVTLKDMDGKPAPLRQLLESGRPVLLDFVYTSCTAICPLLSETFAQVQRELGAEAAGLTMVSISIDPEVDTPKVLRGYAQIYHAGPQWRFLTGDPKDIAEVQRAFDAYRANKMDHASIVLLRQDPGGKRWVRFEGLVTAGALMREYRSGRSAS
jgi:protein SCO1